MGKRSSFSQAELREKVRYDSESGLFYSLRKTARSSVGDVVTNIRPDGYCRVNVFGGKFLAHRLAWFYMMGVWPESDIDHIDGNPTNNSFSNLRVVARHENMQNIRRLRKNSQTGVNGVSWHTARQKFVVQLSHRGDHKFGGHFNNIDDAIAALKRLKAEWHSYSPLNEEV